MSATFTHWCELCVFLGNFVNEDGEDVDLYVHICPERGSSIAQSYLVRYGSKPEDYCSVPAFLSVDDAGLIEAAARSLQRGITPRVLERED